MNWKYGVAANIVKYHIDEDGVFRHGTKEFVGGAKVYLCGKCWDFGLSYIDVIGLDRYHKYKVYRIDT